MKQHYLQSILICLSIIVTGTVFAVDKGINVSLSDFSVRTKSEGFLIQGKIKNELAYPITAIKIELHCDGVPDREIPIGIRTVHTKVKNRRTGAVERKKYVDFRKFDSGKVVRFKHYLKSEEQLKGCSATVVSWTNYFDTFHEKGLTNSE